jgi:pimeloyl-ACP methyl ester carboxylesterase
MRRTLAVLAAFLLTAAAPPPDPYQPGREILTGLHRIVTPRGVQETFEATLGGARQVVNVRGADRDNPILLFIHGGPGAVEMPFAWTFQRPWEDFFTVVQYDQRGAGRSYLLSDPKALAPTLTIDRYRDDAIELIDLLRKRYGKRKVVLVGHSWGSVVGLSVAAKRPDLLYAYVGMGQYVDPAGGERASYDWTLAQGRREGNAEAIRDAGALSGRFRDREDRRRAQMGGSLWRAVRAPQRRAILLRCGADLARIHAGAPQGLGRGQRLYRQDRRATARQADIHNPQAARLPGVHVRRSA